MKHGLKDSGKREEFATGFVREPRTLKGRFDLISPIALRRLAIHYENGALKYSERNWEKGGDTSRYLCSAISHLQDYLEGDRLEDHLSASVWNIFCIVHTEEMIKRGLLPETLHNMPNYLNETV
jgi:hypothetical protein